MPAVDVVDQSWIGAGPVRVGQVLADPDRWTRWWPELDLRVLERRGPKGVRWQVASAERGQFAGSMEIWLQPVLDGVVAHYFLRLDPRDPAAPKVTERDVGRLVGRCRIATKRAMWELADAVDPARIARIHGPSAR